MNDTTRTERDGQADRAENVGEQLGEMTYRRIHHAPRELLFDCMTQARHLTHFWGPVGTTAPVDRIKIDLRPGGVFETVMVSDSDGSEYPTRAVYVEVSRPDRLVWTETDVEGGMLTVITFVDLGDGRTEVVTHQTNVPEMYRSAEAQAGFLTSLDRCDAYVVSLMTDG